MGRIYDPDGCSPTLNTCGKGSHEPKIVQVGNVNPSGKGMNGNVFSEDGLAPTLTTNKGEGNKILTGIRIRKLTPKKLSGLWDFLIQHMTLQAKLLVTASFINNQGIQ